MIMDERIIRKVIDSTDIMNIAYEFISVEIIDGTGERKMLSGEEFARFSRNPQNSRGFRGRIFLDEPKVARTILKGVGFLQTEMIKAYQDFENMND